MRARACIVLLVAAALFACARNLHSLVLRVRLHGGQKLQLGAPLEVAGVRVGEVISVRPLEFEESEVVFRIDDRHTNLRIPSDSTVSIYRAGLLGEYYLNLEVHGKTGPPANNNAWLREAAGQSQTKNDRQQP